MHKLTSLTLTALLLAPLAKLHAADGPERSTPGQPTFTPAEMADPASAPRDRAGFNEGWRFHRGDPADLKPGELDYATIKDSLLATGNDFTRTNVVAAPTGNPGAGLSFVKPDFDDSSWRLLDLPHDWAIEGPFDIAASGNTGKLPFWGQGWYRKQFGIPSSDKGRRIFLEIDGAMSCSTVWINGRFAGGWPYGYSSYQLDITPCVNFGEGNTVAIRLDNPNSSSRWYPGAGLYRNVWLTKTSPLHITRWGITVTTPEVSLESAMIALKGTLLNQGDKKASASVVTGIYELDAKGRKGGAPVALAPAALDVGEGQRGTFAQSVKLANPKLWNTTDPRRYVAVTTVSVDGKVVDLYETPFGIRDIRFTAADGFLLNGKRVPLNGVCDHHDLGALGGAFNTRAAERQLEILKAMGANALRTSHNMPAPELLDLCDRMGILVMDESFDCWAIRKVPNDYHLFFNDWHERDLRAEIRRDRNHPSVIMWSLGNEIPEQGRKEAVPIAEELVRIAHEEDPTRPATLGGNGVAGWNPAFAQAFDILGENYDPLSYSRIRFLNPRKPLFSSESSSCVSSRGEYYYQTPEGMAAFNEALRKKGEDRHAAAVRKAQASGKPAPPPEEFQPEKFQPVSGNIHEGGMENFQVSSYDCYAPGWAQTPDEEFEALDKNPFVAGEFVWTGFDYLGEPTPFNSDQSNLLNFSNDPVKRAELEKQLKEFGKIKCPSRSSYFGIVDLCGFPKDRFYLYQSRWRPDLPMVHILPHWNWPDRIGKVTPVHVYTSGDGAELFLNGKSLGKRSKLGPDAPADLALHRPAKASSEETVKGNLAGNAVDGNDSTLWVASGPNPRLWWQVDLGSPVRVRQIDLSFEGGGGKVKYTVLGSQDGATWTPVAGPDQATIFGKKMSLKSDATARHLRVEFSSLPAGSWASLRGVSAYDREIPLGSTPYRLFWNDVVYEPGELKAVAYKDGKPWAEETVRTTGPAARLTMEPDRAIIRNDGADLAFVTLKVHDQNGLPVPRACNAVTFGISGPGEIVATDNGDATDLNTFSNSVRKAYNGLALAIIRARKGQAGKITLTAESGGLKGDRCVITSEQ